MSVKSAGKACHSPSSRLRGASCGCKIDTTLFIRKGEEAGERLTVVLVEVVEGSELQREIA